MAHDAERWSPSDELLDRFLAEQTSPDERMAIEHWMASMPVAREAAGALQNLRFDVPLSREEHEALWRRAEQGCGNNVLQPQVVRGVCIPPRPMNARAQAGGRRVFGGLPLPRGWWFSPIGIAVGIVTAVVTWYIVPRFSEPHTAAVSTYVTGAGQRATITLPDGSVVALNVASRLDVPVNYSSGNHTLRLNGQALFAVLRHPGAPLTVVTGKATAQVLGTSFVVRHYASDTAVTVSVREGRVLLQSGTHMVVLTAGRRGEVLQNGLVYNQPADPSQFSFVSGVLTLNRVSLSQAIAELDRWYGVDVRLGNPMIGAQEINGTLSAGSVTDLMAILQLTYNVRVLRDGPVLTISPR